MSIAPFCQIQALVLPFFFQVFFLRRGLRDFRLAQSHYLSGDRACRPGILPFSVSLLHECHRMIVMANVSISTIGMFSRALVCSSGSGTAWS